MKRGDIVKAHWHRGKVVAEGMIVYKKDNDNIGVNFGHYHQLINGVPINNLTPFELRRTLISLGCDEVFCKSELTFIKKFEAI